MYTLWHCSLSTQDMSSCLTCKSYEVRTAPVGWNFLVTSSEYQRKSLLEDMRCTSQPLAKGDLVDHILHTLQRLLGDYEAEQCKNSRLPHLLMIVVHRETLWSPAPQPMDNDDDDGGIMLLFFQLWVCLILLLSLDSLFSIFHVCSQCIVYKYWLLWGPIILNCAPNKKQSILVLHTEWKKRC